MKRKMLSKRANKANFARTAGYTNRRNLPGHKLMRGGVRL